MRLICPECRAEYEIDDGLIPDEGREVQCSNCDHRWFQRPPPLDSALADELGTDPALGAAAQDLGGASEGDAAAGELPAAAPHRIDPRVREILTAEAEREIRARRAAQPLETQEELGLGEAAVRPRRPQPPEIVPPVPPAAVPGLADPGAAEVAQPAGTPVEAGSREPPFAASPGEPSPRLGLAVEAAPAAAPPVAGLAMEAGSATAVPGGGVSARAAAAPPEAAADEAAPGGVARAAPFAGSEAPRPDSLADGPPAGPAPAGAGSAMAAQAGRAVGPDRSAPLPQASAAATGAALAAGVAAPPRNRFPDIEAVNSALDPDRAAPPPGAGDAEAPQGGGGFALGFVAVLALALALWLLYRFAGPLGDTLPWADTVLESYAAEVDGLRGWLQTIARAVSGNGP